MKNRVFVIHGWGGHPGEGWFPWIKEELEIQGFEVFSPKMPNSDSPEISAWVSKLKSVVGTVDTNTFFIGHSIGCQAILRFLETQNSKAGGVVFVAPWTKLADYTYEIDPDAEEVAEPWINTPINWKKLRELSKFTSIFSEDDPYVLLSESEVFREKLNSKIIIEERKGHFNEENDIFELKVAKDEFLKLAK